MKSKPNDELFQTYDEELRLRLHKPKNLTDSRRLLQGFKSHLPGQPPSSEAAKAFLAPFAARKPSTLYRYAQAIKAFMKWYGDPIDDFQV